MKQILSILLLLAASVAPSWGQDKKPFPTSFLEIDKYPDSVLTKYGDSITLYLYHGLYEVGKGSLPIYPKDEKMEYYSPACNLLEEGEGMYCAVNISYLFDKKDNYGIIPGQGVCELRVKDLNGRGENPVFIAVKGIKKIKAHMNLKIVAYIRCDTTAYDKREIKRVTARIKYEPLYKWKTKINYTVDHLKYSDSEKYNRHMKMLKGGWTYTLDKKMRQQDKRKVAERNMPRQF